MQFLVVLTSLLSAASAAAVSPRYPAKLTGGELSKRQSSVCGSNTTPVCCQVDVLGVADTNCGNAGDVSTTAEFQSTCAETGLTAMCCTLVVGADGLLCTAA